MKSPYNIDFLKKPILEVLQSSHYPKSVRSIEWKLQLKGLITQEENEKYRVVLGIWLMSQKNIIAVRQKNSQKAHVYILKENARRYYPELLVDEEEYLNNKIETRPRQLYRSIDKARGEEQ